MERSPYLVQALQELGQAPAAPAMDLNIDLQAAKEKADAIKAWREANPGKSYLKHQLGEAGQNIRNMGHRMGGLFRLGGLAGG